MKSAWFKALVLAVICISVYACKDKHANTVIPEPIVAGKGGLATLQVIMAHDSLYIDSGMVYVKYNAIAAPADNVYDDSALLDHATQNPMAIFPGLKQGDYFIYGKGWDIVRSQTVAGTRPYTITADAKTGTNQLILQTFKK